MKIKILQVDIDLGKKEDICNCPLALACNRHFATSNVEIFGYSGIIDGINYYLTENAKKFIDDFDSEKEVSPCEVELT